MVLSARPVRMSGAFLLALVLASLATPLSAQVRALNLREMAESAGTSFVGTVTETHSGLDDDGEIVTWTTFRVEQPIGFIPVSLVTIKQLGGTANGLTHQVPHMRYFRGGERVLVMFYPTSSLGFTSPIGLDQGVWPVSADGRILGVRQSALEGMDADLARHGITVRPPQDVELDRFTTLLEELLRGRTDR
jgi:hypothetical protein